MILAYPQTKAILRVGRSVKEQDEIGHPAMAGLFSYSEKTAMSAFLEQNDADR